jgi:hypothetical protein
MNLDLSTIVLGLTVLVVVKWFLIVGLFMYLAFAVVIIRQVGVMSEAFEDPFNPLIKIFAWAHLILTILLIILAITLL